MTIPTREEVHKAWEGITKDGPSAPGTLGLAFLAVKNPIISGVIENMRKSHVARMNSETQLFADAMLAGALIYGLNLGLRIGEARAQKPNGNTEPAEPAEPPKPISNELEAIELFAWLGVDELGSGKIGIKQGRVPAGMIPLVAIDREKIERVWPQIHQQAQAYGKVISLCRFKFMEVVRRVGGQ